MPLFPSPSDIAFFQDKNSEFHSLFFLPIKIYKRKAQGRTNPYGEDPNVQWELPVELPGYIPKMNLWDTKNTEFGLDEERKLRVVFSPDLAKKLNIALPDIGDRLEIQNGLFDVVQVNPLDYGSNLQIPLSHVVDVRQVRDEVPGEGDFIHRDY